MNVKKLGKRLKRKVSSNIKCSEVRDSILLTGEVEKYEQVINAGKIAAKTSYRGVINNIKVKGLQEKEIKKPMINDKALEGKQVDVLIIGGGVIGCAIARYLSKWSISILLVEKEDDLAMHQSSRNDGMIHPGISPKPGTLKAKFNVRGNELYEGLANELNISFKRVGSLILFDSIFSLVLRPILINRAKKNKVKLIKLKKKDIKKYEPNVTDKVIGGIYLPSTAICPPYKMTIALAENAIENDAIISLNTIVTNMVKTGNTIDYVNTNRGRIYPKVVINAAGVYSDSVAEMADDRFFTIHPRKGEIALLDKSKGNLLKSIIGVLNIKTALSSSKGGGLVSTYEGNILVGPNAYEQPHKEDYSTHIVNVNAVLDKNLPFIKGITKADIITYLAGTRAATYNEDFIIELSRNVSNLVHAAGIQSPGLASAPAIAERIEEITIDLLKEKMEVKLDENYNPKRIGIPLLNEISVNERNSFIKERKDYGQIICRCEEISKGEIIDAINGTIPATTIDAIKRRTRACMGRCQGGFCLPLIAKIIEEEAGIAMDKITKKGGSSYLLYKETK